MSQRTGSHQQRADDPRASGAERQRAEARRNHALADYTLAHAGRQVRVGPVAFWICVGTLVILGVWSTATATYFAFRDDVLTRLVARQAELQFSYEDRIAELRAQIDRLTSRQLLDQEQFEQKLTEIMRRQNTLESRAATMNGFVDPTATGSIAPAARGARGGDATSPARPRPSPIGDTIIFAAPPDREARLESRAPATARASIHPVRSDGVEGAIARLQNSLDRVESQQINALGTLEESYDAKARRMRGVLADLGIDMRRLPAVAMRGATGGPFVAARPRNDAGAFERQAYRIALARVQVERLNRALIAVPVRRPVASAHETTSGFGMRIDPFMRTPAMHTGLDFRGANGDPVRAAAAGRVTQAGWNGGYGNMVEIDHGNGLSTRYGHLSALGVKNGQTVRAGHVIGHIGSTGRSTGPHLHYEVRAEGDAVDPQKYLRAGVRLGAMH